MPDNVKIESLPDSKYVITGLQKPMSKKDIGELFIKHVPEALSVCLVVIRHKASPQKNKLQAADMILKYARDFALFTDEQGNVVAPYSIVVKTVDSGGFKGTVVEGTVVESSKKEL